MANKLLVYKKHIKDARYASKLGLKECYLFLIKKCGTSVLKNI